MSPRRWAFGLVVVLAGLALFALDGAAGGVAALAAMLLFILACISALRSTKPDRDTDRTGLAGWLGGGF